MLMGTCIYFIEWCYFNEPWPLQTTTVKTKMQHILCCLCLHNSDDLYFKSWIMDDKPTTTWEQYLVSDDAVYDQGAS